MGMSRGVRGLVFGWWWASSTARNKAGGEEVEGSRTLQNTRTPRRACPPAPPALKPSRAALPSERQSGESSLDRRSILGTPSKAPPRTTSQADVVSVGRCCSQEEIDADPARRCTRWYLPLVLLPLPIAPPYFLVLFLLSTTLHARPWCVRIARPSQSRA